MRELIAQAEAFDEEVEYWSRVGDRIFNGNILAEHFKFRADELRAQAQAEQPAEPQGEPWAWSVYVKETANGYVVDDINDRQLIDDATNYGATVTPLYPIPDPRIAALEALLRDIRDKWREDGLYRIGEDIERIEAALGKEG